MTLLAHVGHWSSWVVYLGPILLVGAWLGLEKLREGRRRGNGTGR